MAFATFPLPDPNSKIGQLNDRIQAQTEALTPVLAKMYSALDGAITSQAKALGPVGNRLTRALNGRIKAQGVVASGVVGNAVSALGDRIDAQGRAIDLQSALLPRLVPPGAVPGTSAVPSTPGAVPPILPVGGGGLTPNGQLRPSLPAGVSSPVFTPPTFPATTQTSGGVAIFNPQSGVPVPTPPAAPAPIQQPSPGAGNVFHWGVLCDCAKRILLTVDLDDPAVQSAVASGSYVPIRYSHDPLTTPIPPYGDYGATELADGFMSPNLERQASWIEVAVHAYFNKGDKWPANGDFPHDVNPDYPYDGLPVGDWPFDSNGNYIGL